MSNKNKEIIKASIYLQKQQEPYSHLIKAKVKFHLAGTRRRILYQRKI